ncbi:hypothetical protein MAR_018209 [Mya arenaria]|uniref:Uncharacterized protein n=1 Tax=Mya arenaria TaxID=6604 RepID=A0ABY7EHH5_MYAAR|nr:hypothetical protein MAR_018209 [Mya arenaria]
MPRSRAPVTKPKSLLEEVKESVNWSSRVNPSTHARPVTAREHHNVVCFSLRDGHRFTHLQVKELVESQIQCKVKYLQCDPVSVRSGDSETLDRWIVTFDSAVTCGRAMEHGLAVGGDRVLVRAWADIVREEAMLDEWGQSCNFRLPQTEKHSRALHKFLKGVTRGRVVGVSLALNHPPPDVERQLGSEGEVRKSDLWMPRQDS